MILLRVSICFSEVTANPRYRPPVEAAVSRRVVVPVPNSPLIPSGSFVLTGKTDIPAAASSLHISAYPRLSSLYVPPACPLPIVAEAMPFE